MRPVSSWQASSAATGLPSRPGKGLLDLPMGDRLAAALAHRHFLPGMRMAVDRRIDRAALPVRARPRRRPCSRAASSPVRPWSANCAVSDWCARSFFADHHQPGGVLVEPVHDARAAARRRCRTGSPRNGRSARSPACRSRGRRPGCTTSPLGLSMTMMSSSSIDDIERDILAGGLGGDRLRHVDCDRIARCDMISGVADGGGL